MEERPYFGKVHISNFRSIRRLTVDLQPVTLLVGHNGAGKSNIIDALVFVSDAVTRGLSAAVGERGGLQTIRFQPASPPGRSSGRPTQTSIEVVFYRPAGQRKRVLGYGLKLDAHSNNGGLAVVEEWVSENNRLVFWRQKGNTIRFGPSSVSLSSSHLALPLLGLPTTVRLQQLLEGVFASKIQTDTLRKPQSFDSSQALKPTGENLNYIWQILQETTKPTADRIVQLLGQILPNLEALDTRSLGSYRIIEATFNVDGKQTKIEGTGLSDGTLRALALLVAVYQPQVQTMVAVEEPEVALHPYAAGLLFKALLSAPNRPQLLLSTHSPSILESGGLDLSQLCVVKWESGQTVAGPLAKQQLTEIKKHLTTGAELLAEGSLELAVRKTHKGLRPAVVGQP